MSAEQEVARAQRVALAVEDLADPGPQSGEVGLLFLEDGLGRAIGPLQADGQWPRRGGAGDDVVGRHEPAEAFFQLRQDRGGVGVGEPVGLVEDDDRALPLADQGRQRLELGANQVVVEHENQEVGAGGQLAGFALALGRRPRRFPTGPACRSGRPSPRLLRACRCGSRPAGSSRSSARSCRPRARAAR